MNYNNLRDYEIDIKLKMEYLEWIVFNLKILI